jgi:hypothetical protein
MHNEIIKYIDYLVHMSKNIKKFTHNYLAFDIKRIFK